MKLHEILKILGGITAIGVSIGIFEFPYSFTILFLCLGAICMLAVVFTMGIVCIELLLEVLGYDDRLR